MVSVPNVAEPVLNGVVSGNAWLSGTSFWIGGSALAPIGDASFGSTELPLRSSLVTSRFFNISGLCIRPDFAGENHRSSAQDRGPGATSLGAPPRHLVSNRRDSTFLGEKWMGIVKISGASFPNSSLFRG